ncbi:DUF983 domain-containing protein [Sphingomonas sp. PB4P5]|uniref:DUF983 domain-containing protein n=1 Tax=Parasphingomonas puruogangriensis TaxID=3096155 RepID=UPI002FC88862
MRNEHEAAPPRAFAEGEEFRWILRCGWKGLCPRCGIGRMFRSWLKITDRCEHCGLNYRFAAPDDGPAFFSLCIIALPLIFFVVWLQVTFDPPYWVHLVTSFPIMALGTLLPLRPIKGWLVASQFVNRAQEAGTKALWAQLHGTDPEGSDFDQ